MINLKPIITAASLLMLLNACSSGSSPVTTTVISSGTEVSVIGASGITVGLDGTYLTSCYITGGGSTSSKEKIVISSDIWTYTVTDYTDTDCRAVSPTTGTIYATFSAGTDSTITGWYDGSGSPVAAPTAADASGPLDDLEPFTSLTRTVTAVSGSFFGQINAGETSTFFYVVDDTGTGKILYRDNSYDAGDLNASISAPYTKL